MTNLTIRQAREGDIPVIESILLDTVNWLNEIEQPLWEPDWVTWDALAKSYRIEDFFIADSDGVSCGCVALVDHDPFFWPDIEKGASLFIHKLAVTKAAKGSGAADALMEYAAALCKEKRIPAIRLDCHQHRPKLRAFYEKHGFVCVDERTLGKDKTFFTAFYMREID
ncbi:MAG: GNAT family N-acetyltransferase [Oscillospiraceae bacterium]|nr:GNAT family N-acetyltransferase [Oscillospiraceae bacterium]